MDSFDYIIVGAGSAGCVLANRLSVDGGVRVLLLEAGGRGRSPIVAMPAATDIYGIGNPRFDWCFVTEPDPTREGRRDPWPRGKGLGGSSLINGMVHCTGFPGDYDDWETAGAAGWDHRTLAPYFARSMADGGLVVGPVRSPHPLTGSFLDAARNFGLARAADASELSGPGAAPVRVTQRRGRRISNADAYLRPARHRPNLTVRPHCPVLGLVLERNRVTGVRYRRSGATHTVLAEREVILCAGTVGSPHLLQLSGIGPGDALKRVGIPVRHELPGVGRNLRDHVGLYVTARVRHPTYNSEQSWPKRIRHAANWLFRGEGPATTPGGQAIAYLQADGSAPRPDLQIQFTPVGYRLTSEGLELPRESMITLVVNVNRPESRGSVSVKSADPAAAPSIAPRLLESARDRRTLAAGVELARELMAVQPLSGAILAEVEPGSDVATEKALAAYLRRHAVTNYHPVGTCRIGADAEAVVGPDLRLRGLEGLRVADASVMPRLVSGNINATVTALAERAADLILGEPRAGTVSGS